MRVIIKWELYILILKFIREFTELLSRSKILKHIQNFMQTSKEGKLQKVILLSYSLIILII